MERACVLGAQTSSLEKPVMGKDPEEPATAHRSDEIVRAPSTPTLSLTTRPFGVAHCERVDGPLRPDRVGRFGRMGSPLWPS